MGEKIGVVGDRKTTVSISKFQCVGIGVASRREALREALRFYCPIRFFNKGKILLLSQESVVNAHLGSIATRTRGIEISIKLFGNILTSQHLQVM